ncbi:hypothetical protein L218DRAFT_946001 [Marasmius fiardii PR-910]|nr:hypothetical protein L218DRAFT_946001 [Marasmius fiardii PR-910]
MRDLREMEKACKPNIIEPKPKEELFGIAVEVGRRITFTVNKANNYDHTDGQPSSWSKIAFDWREGNHEVHRRIHVINHQVDVLAAMRLRVEGRTNMVLPTMKAVPTNHAIVQNIRHKSDIILFTEWKLWARNENLCTP